ncbi:MAG: UDP-N-acetylmuramoyl-tripeptide--D-alanyl-D-alanine ligase [Eubacteriales bacterium]|nr:UDP-N-acetylmuramoyl-tripeptide--D-alanyl-D-alanine ligase [Eubacteriales bacterium]
MRKRLQNYLYKMQIAGYHNPAYWRLVEKSTTGKFNLTARVKRLRAVTVLLCVLGLGLPCCCLARTVALANWCLQPWERQIQRYWLKKAQRTLARHSGLIKIGITGSYGKTSVKNILAAMLSTKYKVVASPASFNTPMGFARTVNQNLQPDTQVLIMEMGARHVGEIREMCELVKPDHGIVTSIGECHLATFGSLANIVCTKGELFACLPPDGIAVTDGDNPWCRKLAHPHLVLVKAAEQPTYQTALLGEHQQKNIQLAAALARRLGITSAMIKRVALNLQPTPHRLARMVAPNGIIILDDSYNANPASATAALKVLSSYQSRKVVQTPGFVEQGLHTTAAHLQLCRQIKNVADAVIVVGKLNREDFVRGLSGWHGEVVYVSDREAAKVYYPRLLKSGDVLLILNDIPEQY